MSLWLPNWPIDRLRQSRAAPKGEDGRPFVLSATFGNRRLVTAADAAAQALGIAPGLPLADARALHPGLAVAAADPVADAAALARLAQWCGRYSPWTAPHGAEGVWLDVTGCAHLHGGEEHLVAEVVERLGRRGVACRAAIADTPGAAWAVAQHGSTPATLVPPGAARTMLAALPVRALRLDGATALGLDRLGLRRIGELYALPRAALAARFGAAVAHRLDQALGTVAEPLSPLPPAPMRWARRRFAEPIATPEDLAAAMGELVEGLTRRLAAEALGARRLALRCYRIDGGQAAIAIGTARPSRDPLHLGRLLRERLAEIDPGLGVEDMVLAATMVEPLAAAQLGLAPWTHPAAGEGGGEAALAALIDRLANRLGPAALGSLVPHESHVPERAVRFVPALAAVMPQHGVAWEAEPLRPIRLLAWPEAVEAVAPVPDDPPILFRWRRLPHRVRRADGPERIAGEWWRGAAEAAELRDYYRVEDEAGRRFWLYRSGLYRQEVKARWFLHGFFA